MKLSDIFSRSSLVDGLKSSAFKTFAIFAGGSFFCTILNGIGGLIQARWVSPDVFGEFQKYGILTTYLGIGILVVNDGLIRQYPYYLGRGEKEKALEIAGVAKWWFLLVTYIIGGIFSVLTILALIRGDWRAACGWGAQIVMAISGSYGIFLGIMYRTSSDFRRLTSNGVWSSFVAFVALGFVRLWGYFGIALRTVVLTGFGVWINRHYLPVKVKAIFNPKELMKLAKISLQFSLPAYFHASFLLASRRALILLYCTQAGLGLYSFAAALVALAHGFTTALQQILNVKINTRFGETESIWKSLKASIKPTVLGLMLSVAMIAICWFVLPWMVEWLIPKYVGAIPCFRMLLFSLITGALCLPLLVFKAALMWKTAAAQAISNFCVTVLLIWLLPKNLVMIALATIMGGVAELVVGYGMLVRLFWIERHSRRIAA